MKQTSLSLINDLLHPWIGAADDDEVVSAYANLDSDDEASVKSAIQADILPYVMTMPLEKRLALTRALEEVEKLPREQLERIWESILPPFSLPTTPGLLFRWIATTIATAPDSPPPTVRG